MGSHRASQLTDPAAGVLSPRVHCVSKGTLKQDLHRQNQSLTVRLLLPPEPAALFPLPQHGLCSIRPDLVSGFSALVTEEVRTQETFTHTAVSSVQGSD